MKPQHKTTQLSLRKSTSSPDSVGSFTSYSHICGRHTSDDSNIFTSKDPFELGRNQLRSISQPSTPRPHASTKYVRKTQSCPDRPAIGGIEKPLNECPSSSLARNAKTMQPPHFRAPVPAMWTREIDNAVDPSVHLLPLYAQSSHSSTKLVEDESVGGFFVQNQYQVPYTTINGTLIVDDHEDYSSTMSFPKYQLTPQAMLAIETSNKSDPAGHYTGTTYSSTASTIALSTLTPSSSLGIPVTALDSTNSSNHELIFSNSCIVDLSNTRTMGYWNDGMMQLAQTTYPTHRESNMCTASQKMLISMTSLGIDTSSFSDTNEYPSQLEMQLCHPAMHPIPSDHVDASKMASINTCSLSRSPFPLPQPHFYYRRSAGQAQHMSITQSHRKPSMFLHSPTRAPSDGNVRFVNFTSDDSQKILAGVAPSGSSKTKARREKDAVEKRRKLNQAVV